MSDFTQKIDAGRARHQVWKPYWAERMAFFEGRQFVWRSSRGNLNELPTGMDRDNPWIQRTQRNRLFKIVNAEVSAGTNRAPGWDVLPTTTDQEDIDAARLSVKVLLYLYDLLTLRRTMANAFRYAVVCGEGFVYPYWNPAVGKELPPGEEGEETLREGQLAMDVLGPDVVFWEAGLTFDKSPWHAVEKAMPIDRAKQLAGYNGAVLKADSLSQSSLVSGALDSRNAMKADAVSVTEYLELPSDEHPEGRRFYVANGNRITDPEPYPILIEGPQGYEPVLHKVSYIETPSRDRDMSLVEHLMDPQRAANDGVNKQLEWMRLALNPQIITGPGGLTEPYTTEPGQVIRPKGDPNQTKWREVPPIPPELQQIIDQAFADMEEISAQRSVPSQVESGKAIAAILEKDDSVRAHIVQNLADVWSRLGRHSLCFVQKHYTERRLIQVSGHNNIDYVSFKGSEDLRSQVGVRVLPGSIEPKTRQAIETKVFAMADRGWITKQQAMRALENGTAEALVEEIDEDTGLQTREIAQMVAMGNENLPGGDVPIAEPFHDHAVHLYVLHRWMKSADWPQQPGEVQEAARLHEQQHQTLLQQQQFEEAQRQQQMAEQQGLDNAAKPQNGAKPFPDKSSAGESDIATPNQPLDQSVPA